MYVLEVVITLFFRLRNCFRCITQSFGKTKDLVKVKNKKFSQGKKKISVKVKRKFSQGKKIFQSSKTKKFSQAK